MTKTNIFPCFYLPKGNQKTIAIRVNPIFDFFNSTYSALSLVEPRSDFAQNKMVDFHEGQDIFYHFSNEMLLSGLLCAQNADCRKQSKSNFAALRSRVVLLDMFLVTLRVIRYDQYHFPMLSLTQYGLECLANLDLLPSKGFSVTTLPLNIGEDKI